MKCSWAHRNIRQAQSVRPLEGVSIEENIKNLGLRCNFFLLHWMLVKGLIFRSRSALWMKGSRGKCMGFSWEMGKLASVPLNISDREPRHLCQKDWLALNPFKRLSFKLLKRQGRLEITPSSHRKLFLCWTNCCLRFSSEHFKGLFFGLAKGPHSTQNIDFQKLAISILAVSWSKAASGPQEAVSNLPG